MKVLFILVLALALGVGFYIYRDIRSPLEPLPPPPTPSLDRPINITANLPDQTKKLAREKIAYLVGELKANPDFFAAWLDLGLYRKLIGDFEGARETWEYAGVIRPLNFISFGNLGGLYAYDLKDPAKSEANFLKALENGPEEVQLYEKLYEVYRFMIKNEDRARAILEKGIAANPQTSGRLQNLLRSF